MAKKLIKADEGLDFTQPHDYVKFPEQQYEKLPLPVRQEGPDWDKDIPHQIMRDEFSPVPYMPFLWPLNDGLVEERRINKYDTTEMDHYLDQTDPSTGIWLVDKAGRRYAMKSSEVYERLSNCVKTLTNLASNVEQRNYKAALRLDLAAEDLGFMHANYGLSKKAWMQTLSGVSQELEEIAQDLDEDYPLLSAQIDEVNNTIGSLLLGLTSPLRTQRDYGEPGSLGSALDKASEESSSKKTASYCDPSVVVGDLSEISRLYEKVYASGRTNPGWDHDTDQLFWAIESAIQKYSAMIGNKGPTVQTGSIGLKSKKAGPLFKKEVFKEYDIGEKRNTWHWEVWKGSEPVAFGDEDTEELADKKADDVISRESKVMRNADADLGRSGNFPRPKFVPPELNNLWQQAVDHVSDAGKIFIEDPKTGKDIFNYPMAIAIYKNILKKHQKSVANILQASHPWDASKFADLGYPAGFKRPSFIPSDMDDLFRRSLDVLEEKGDLTVTGADGSQLPNYKEAVQIYNNLVKKYSEGVLE